MGLEKPKFEILHGGPELKLEEAQLRELFDSYKEQFVKQQADGLTDEAIINYLKYVLELPETVVLFSPEGQLLGMGGIRYFDENPRYANNSIVELGTLVVTHAARGSGLSEDILSALKIEALDREKKKPGDRGMIFSLMTANPAVVRQATKAGYTVVSDDHWIDMIQKPQKREHLEKYGYKPYVNMDSYKENPKPVNDTLTKVKTAARQLLSDLIWEE